TISAGERLTYDGTVYTLPLPDSEGRALRSPAGPVDVPIYIASLGPANLRLTGEVADGWIGTAFLPEAADTFLDFIREGATAAGRTLDDIELTVAASLEFTDDLEEAGRRHAEGYAFTLGAMGSAKTNFYNQALAPPGLCRRCRRSPATVARGRPRGRSRPSPHRHRTRHQSHWRRQTYHRTTPPLPRRRHQHPPCPPQCHPPPQPPRPTRPPHRARQHRQRRSTPAHRVLSLRE